MLKPQIYLAVIVLAVFSMSAVAQVESTAIPSTPCCSLISTACQMTTPYIPVGSLTPPTMPCYETPTCITTQPYCTGSEPYCTGSDPYCTGSEPYCTGSEPFCTGSEPYCTWSGPYCTPTQTSCPITEYDCPITLPVCPITIPSCCPLSNLYPQS